MTASGRILVLTSCTARKAVGARHVALPAEDLYTGQQHVRLMCGIRAYRHAGEPNGAVDLRVLSARHGLVAGSAHLYHYDESFSGLRKAELRQRADNLGVPTDMATLLAQPWRLVIVLLGEFYLQAACLDEHQSLGGPTIAFTSPHAGARLPRLGDLTVVPLNNREAQRFSCGLTSLKGELARRLLQRLATTGPRARVPERSDAILDWLERTALANQGQLQLAAA